MHTADGNRDDENKCSVNSVLDAALSNASDINDARSIAGNGERATLRGEPR